MNKMINFLDSLIGLTYEDAVKLCDGNNYKHRIVCNDDHNYVVTCDFRVNRINFYLKNNIVIKCDIG